MGISMMLSLKVFINALESEVLLSLLALGIEHNFYQIVLFIYFLYDLLAKCLIISIAYKGLLNLLVLLGVEFPDGQRHIPLLAVVVS